MFGFIKIAQGLTAGHGATLRKLGYKVITEQVQFPASKTKKGKVAGPQVKAAFKIECNDFHLDPVDASTKESVLAAVKEVVTGKKLFTYKTPFIVSPLAKPMTGTAACVILDKTVAGLSCLVAWSEAGLKGEATTPDEDEKASDILGQLGIDPESL